jgi:TonB family protein
MPALPALPVRADILPPAPPVRTDNFASITVSPAVNSKPALPVETGAFQTPVSNQRAAAQTVAKTGVFDGREIQNSRTGAAIVKVAAAGFGDAPVNRAAIPRGEVGSRGDAGFGPVAAPKLPVETKPAVRAGGFDSSTAAPPALPQRQMEQVRPTEVEILLKPRPAYTEEARRLKIEGEVLVKVLFAASGEVKVLSVEKGLGHGLDEAALQAAANIRFKPAKRGGVAVDSTAVARITFQLAY